MTTNENADPRFEYPTLAGCRRFRRPLQSLRLSAGRILDTLLPMVKLGLNRGRGGYSAGDVAVTATAARSCSPTHGRDVLLDTLADLG